MEPNNFQSSLDDASRISRFFASLVDTIVMLIITIPVAYIAAFYGKLESENLSMGAKIILFITFLSCYFGINFKYLRGNAQTIGKKLFGIRVVNLDGSKPSLKYLLIKRYIPYFGFGLIPYIGAFINLINIAFIFAPKKRCIHDHIAGTRVVKG